MNQVHEFSSVERIGKIIAALALAFAVLAHAGAAAAVVDAAFKGTASGDFVWNVGDTGGNLTGSFSHLGFISIALLCACPPAR